MSLLGGIGKWLRDQVDDIGSVVTGQPAHGAPTPAPQAPQVQAAPRAPTPSPFQTQTPFTQNLMNGGFKPPQVPSQTPTPQPLQQPQVQAKQRLIAQSPFQQQSQQPQGDLLHKFVINPATGLASSIEKSPVGTGIRVAAADITHNPVARQNAIAQGNAAFTEQKKNFIPNLIMGAGEGGLTRAGAEAAGEEAAKAAVPKVTPPETPSAPQPRPGFIIQESKPLPDGSKIVIRANKNPDTGQLSLAQERVYKNTDQPTQAGMRPPSEVQQYSNVFNIPENQARQELNQPAIKLAPRPAVTPLELDASKQLKLGTTTRAQRQAENTELNPTKVSIPEVNPGDYAKARSNAQLASAPIDVATKHAMQAIKRLDPDEKANFWKAVEEPNGNYSPNMREAINRWSQLSNHVHATSQALGGDTVYLKNYARHEWDLSNPEDAARFAQLAKERGTRNVDPFDFAGLDRQPRVFRSINEGEQAGFHLTGDDPAETIRNYGTASAHALKQQALAKGFTEADMGMDKTRAYDMGGLKTIPLSEKGMQEIKAFDTQYRPTQNKVIKLARTVNQGAKSSILSLGQFHTINIGALRAAPTLIMEGHPVAAAKGLGGMFRVMFGSKYAERVIGKAIQDGTVDKAARIGMPYGGSGYDMVGTFLKRGLGSDLVFGKQIPMMHDQVVRSIISDLEKKGIDLDSPEARNAGLAGANLMGELNREVLNISPRLQQTMSDLMLAGQFTPSKFLQIGRATTKGVGGSYARANIAANAAAAFLVIAGAGLISHQKSDDIRDMLLRALIDPAGPTPTKDQKDNTIKLKVPGTDTSDIAKLIGMKLVRNPDGHLGVSWNPHNAPTSIAEFGRARLSPLASSVLKDATNQTYANKPVYDPNAPAGKKAIQIATSTALGLLPIALQGVPMTQPVEKHLPGSAQEILNAQKPGTDPLLKSIAASFGLTPATDTTVGKGLQTSQYFDAKAAVDKGFNNQEQSAFNILTGSKKNPVTGAYDVNPSVFDPATKAELSLQNPKVFNAIVSMNQRLASEGQGVDPLYTALTPDQQKAYLVYQTIDRNNTAQLTAWKQQNPWYGAFQQQRAEFFNSLPPGDPNKPKSPIEAPTQTEDVQQAFNEYDSITDPQQRSAYFASHPQLGQYMDQVTDYTNQVLKAQGMTPLKPFPKADAQTQAFMATYMNADKATRKAMSTSNPQDFTKMQAYMQNVDEYEVAKNGALDQLQGQTPNQQLLKGINNLAQYDMVKNPDGTLALKYGSVNPGATTFGSVAATPQTGAVSTGGSGGFGNSHKKLKFHKAYVRRIKVRHTKQHKVFLKTPPSIIKIRNKAPQHVGIKRTTYM